MEITNCKGEIRKNELMSKHTSFAIGGPADILASPVDRDDLVMLLKEIRQQGAPYYILGSGTNLLVKDGGFRGVMISLKRMHAIRIEREYRSIGGSYVAVQAEAGAPLTTLLAFSLEKGFTGLEFAAGIPGTIGGAICMNAGTGGGAIGDIIESVSILSPEGTVVKKSREEMKFGYRTSSIPAGHLVLDASVILRRDDAEKIKKKVKELIDTRKQRQPWGLPNAGSMFKNPQEESAGRLIETAGLKGRTIGNAQVSDKHANFIVNTGKATAADVLQLMEIVKQAVLEVHGVRLEPEIKVIGEE